METLLKMGAPIAALFTHRDDPHEEIWWRSCTELAERNGVPVFTDGVDLAAARIDAMKPAVIYSFYYRYLIPEKVLELAPLGAFNLHGSLLPAYRGRAPVNWMLVNGEREAGVTLHHMVPRADAGDIVGQRAVAIDDNDNALTLYRKLVPLGVDLIDEMHPMIVAGSAHAAKNGYREGKLLRAQKAGGRKDRLAVAGTQNFQPGAGRDTSLSRRVLFRWRAKASDMGSEDWRRKWSVGGAGAGRARNCRRRP